MKKKLYEVPEAEQFFVKIEENFLQASPTFSSKGTETMNVEEEEDF